MYEEELDKSQFICLKDGSKIFVDNINESEDSATESESQGKENNNF